ncbi:MAG: ATP-binding protein [Erysipelotrichaceae bacterium]|jgi:predicted ATPase|nr:ATP-binding protein [Erysipelotrichaceae bacterium]
MELNKISINGFKNIIDTKIHFSKITGLLSVNSYGKSNLFAGMGFGFSFIQAKPNEKKNMMSYKGGMPLNECNKYTNFEFEIELSLLVSGVANDVIYGYSFQWNISEDRKPKILTEYLKIKNSLDSQKFTQYISRNENKKLYRTAVSGRCDVEIQIDDNELIINKVLAFDSLYYLNIIKELNNLRLYVDRHLDSSNSFYSPSIIMRGMDVLSIDNVHEIARTLFHLKNRYPKKYSIIIDAFKTMFPFIIDVQVKEHKLNNDGTNPNFDDDAPFEFDDRIYTLYAKHKHMITAVSFGNLSDGTKRILLILTYIILAEINNLVLICIEEPENSINPGLLKNFLSVLDTFVEDSKVIITSHSPFLVSFLNPSDLYIGLPNEDGKACFRKIKKGSIGRIENEAKTLDMLTGEYIFDLMNGSSSDIADLQGYLENE